MAVLESTYSGLQYCDHGLHLTKHFFSWLNPVDVKNELTNCRAKLFGEVSEFELKNLGEVWLSFSCVSNVGLPKARWHIVKRSCFQCIYVQIIQGIFPKTDENRSLFS